ncbi:MAG: hypothetical protein ACI8RD_014840, partial [Bacillariaceae sp.]
FKNPLKIKHFFPRVAPPPPPPLVLFHLQIHKPHAWLSWNVHEGLVVLFRGKEKKITHMGECEH